MHPSVIVPLATFVGTGGADDVVVVLVGLLDVVGGRVIVGVYGM